ncbi:MAG: hypothetical protein JXR91_12110 [Deltaproteobacteria bacterium]|nr:hypothetical protein [Deltaproteobacteria bacterium]
MFKVKCKVNMVLFFLLMLPAGCGHSGAGITSNPVTVSTVSNDNLASDGSDVSVLKGETETPAFAFYFQDETLLIPLGKGVREVRKPGIWMSDGDDSNKVYHYVLQAAPAVTGLPLCACNEQKGACVNQAVQRTIDVTSGVPVASDTGCTCHGWTAPKGEVGAGEYPMYRSNEYYGWEYRPCGIEEYLSLPESVVGGAVYLVGTGSSLSDPCGNSSGTNIYSMWGSEISLAGEVMHVEREDVQWQYCEVGTPPSGHFDPRDTLLQSEDGGSEDGGSDDEYKYLCLEREPDVEFPYVRNGFFCRLGENMSVVGLDAFRVSCLPLAENCPSTLDPCGTGKRFPKLNKEAMWWASTDERGAASFIDGEITVHWIDENNKIVSIKIKAGKIKAGDENSPVGVQYFHDSASLTGAMEHNYLSENSAATVESKLCKSDDDCNAMGYCGARCLLDGTCTKGIAGECSEVFPCDEGYFCVGGNCDSCRTSGDCSNEPEAQECIDGVCVDAKDGKT